MRISSSLIYWFIWILPQVVKQAPGLPAPYTGKPDAIHQHQRGTTTLIFNHKLRVMNKKQLSTQIGQGKGKTTQSPESYFS